MTNDHGDSWPEPDRSGREHSERVVRVIRDELDANDGWISFSRFMDLALYAPGVGYYSAGTRKFGPDGDFVTAPEVSTLFSRCVAGQCAEVLDGLGGGDILELGGGSGVMAADLLLELERLERLPRHYFVLEVSAELRQRQGETLQQRAPHLHSRVVWLDTLPDEPLTGIVLANEVIDALPAERFRIAGGKPEVEGVVWEGDRFGASFRPAGPELVTSLETVCEDTGVGFPEGYRSELRPGLAAWMTAVAAVLKRGVVLFSDYGMSRKEYYQAGRSGGTLMCHYRHRAHDNPYVLVGLQDITAWVDFTSLADAAVNAGLSLAGYTTQAWFLIAAGLDRYYADTRGQKHLADPRHELELARQVKLLTLPGEMGERFKFIGFQRDYDADLSGFSHRDLSGTL